MNSSDRSSSTPNLAPERSFEQHYPNPIISKQAQLRPDVEVWSVFDRAHLVKDPIRKTSWLVYKDHKDPLSVESVSKYYATSSHPVQTEAEALSLCKIAFQENAKEVVSEENIKTLDVPEKIRPQLRIASVAKEGKSFRVHLQIFTRRGSMRIYGFDNRCVTAYEFVVSGNELKTKQEDDIWSADEIHPAK